MLRSNVCGDRKRRFLAGCTFLAVECSPVNADTSIYYSASQGLGEAMSNYISATPSFISGAARALDLGGVFDSYNNSPTPEIANARGLAADWIAVGRYLRIAVRDFRAELGPQEAP